MAGKLQETLRILEDARQACPDALVAYSDGKDSRAVAELCKRAFVRVEAFHMYTVPGLRCVDDALAEASRRWGMPIRQYPHWMLRRFLVEGVYCNNSFRWDALPEWTLRNVYDMAMHDAQIPLIVHGAKRSDSLWRRRNLKAVTYKDVIYPIVGWKKIDVLGYLRSQGISIPKSSGRSATGIDLTTPSLLWLYDTYPDDFRRLCEYFPYAEAVVWRRKWHGVTG